MIRRIPGVHRDHLGAQPTQRTRAGAAREPDPGNRHVQTPGVGVGAEPIQCDHGTTHSAKNSTMAIAMHRPWMIQNRTTIRISGQPRISK